jgi:diadenosine tetraphosphatase ApaH/serine/threonine PP2A family protein phosphatase
MVSGGTAVAVSAGCFSLDLGMRTALFADIHANREALEACLSHAELYDVYQYAFLGDLIGYGADPGWVLDIISYHHEHGAIVVLGNHDEAVSLKKPDKTMNSDAQYAVDWTRSHITTAQTQFLEQLPLTVEQSDSLYVHANAWNPSDWEYVISAAEAKQSLAATPCRLTFCGHLHDPALYNQGAAGRVAPFTPVPGVDIPLGSQRRWLVVLGSVGQPRDRNPAACYALFDSVRNTLTYFRVPFDIESAAGKIRAAGLPDWLGTRLAMGV